MKIRDFNKNDILEICQLFQYELGYEISIEDLSQKIDEMMKIGNYHIFVAEENDKIIGFIGLEMSMVFEIEGKIIRIIALAVNHDFQRKGVGKKLLNHVKLFARKNHISVITLSSGIKRLDAHLFYEKQGFYKKGYSFLLKIDKEII